MKGADCSSEFETIVFICWYPPAQAKKRIVPQVDWTNPFKSIRYTVLVVVTWWWRSNQSFDPPFPLMKVAPLLETLQGSSNIRIAMMDSDENDASLGRPENWGGKWVFFKVQRFGTQPGNTLPETNNSEIPWTFQWVERRTFLLGQF